MTRPNPDCVDVADGSLVTATPATPTAACPEGSRREFAPVNDIHIAIITSSLGDNGGNFCPEVSAERPENIAQNDGAKLVGSFDTTRSEGLTFQSPFLAWSANDAASYQTAIEDQKAEFRNMVTAAGELGCGFEMTLESWYRFLVDPVPPLTVDLRVPGDTTTNTVRSNIKDGDAGIDTTILEQRAAFLRPDSLLGVVMLTDEDDCSLQDSGIVFLPAITAPMKRGTSICDIDPNDVCCQSCYFDGRNGCEPDPACEDGGVMASTEDYSGLRCWQQKRRFGYDFLMPIDRYYNALTQPFLCTGDGNYSLACAPESDTARWEAEAPYRMANPLYSMPASYDAAKLTGRVRQSPELVYLAGIVGVPWQDVATDASLLSPTDLVYQSAEQIDWNLILPKVVEETGLSDPSDTPDDPHMIQAITPRSGSNPRANVNATIASPDAMPDADPIAMHEWYPTGDLEYACTFSLEQPLVAGEPTAVKDCTDNCASDDSICRRRLVSCSCTEKDEPATSKNPVCQAPDGSYGITQYAAKAYPGQRQLELLRKYHLKALPETTTNNSIVASICPKNLDFEQQSSRSYGYNPAVGALIDRIKDEFATTCLPRPLATDENGTVPCALVEAVNLDAANPCDCSALGRDVPSERVQSTVRNALADGALCDTELRPACDEMCLCELPQLNGDTTCLNTPNIETTAASPGFCYVDPEAGFGSTALVETCPASQQRIIRVVGSEQDPAPAPGSYLYLACPGEGS